MRVVITSRRSHGGIGLFQPFIYRNDYLGPKLLQSR